MPYLAQQHSVLHYPTATAATGVTRQDFFRVPYPMVISKIQAFAGGTATGVTVTLLKNGTAVSSGVVCAAASTWYSKTFTTGLTAAKNDKIGYKVTVGGQLSKGACLPLTIQVDVKIDQWYLHMDN